VDPDLLNTEPDPAFQVNPDPIWIRSFDVPKLKKKILHKIKSFLYQKMLFTYVQATGEAFNPQKRTSITSRNGIY
jgi:hypothetical protein